MKKKNCIKCGIKKILDSFYTHPKMKDGHLGKCKDCCRKDSLNNRHNNIERVRAYDRKRGTRQTYVDTKLYRELFPLRYKATNAVNNAVRDGKLTKPNRCEICKKRRRVEGHHNDYSKPLKVVWVCKPCHIRI